MEKRNIIVILLLIALATSTLISLYMYYDTLHHYESLQKTIKYERVTRYRNFLESTASALYAIRSGLNYYYKHNNTCRGEVAKTYLAYATNLIDASEDQLIGVSDISLGLNGVDHLQNTIMMFAHSLRTSYLGNLDLTMRTLLKYNETIANMIDDLEDLGKQLHIYLTSGEIDEAIWDSKVGRVVGLLTNMTIDLQSQ